MVMSVAGLGMIFGLEIVSITEKLELKVFQLKILRF